MSEKNIENLYEELSKLTVLEVSELVSKLEEEWGVSAAAPAMSMPMMMPGAGGGDDADTAEEQTEFDVILASYGEKKINVIKEVRALTGLGLKEAKDLVEGVPSAVKEAVAKDEAEEVKAKLEGAGATVEIK